MTRQMEPGIRSGADWKMSDFPLPVSAITITSLGVFICSRAVSWKGFSSWILKAFRIACVAFRIRVLRFAVLRLVVRAVSRAIPTRPQPFVARGGAKAVHEGAHETERQDGSDYID
jgi:hypothetical protein